MLEGYKLRTEHQMQLLAWQTANIMNVSLKKPVTVGQLLGKEKKMTNDDKEAEFEKLKSLLAKQKEAE